MLDTLKTALAQLEIDVSAQCLDKIDRFYHLLMEKNLVMDLTNITEPREVALRHMADSLFLLKCVSFEGKKVLDIGTGAGFPGVPLLMTYPDLDITMLDSTAKRVDFIADSIKQIGDFPKAHCATARAEELSVKPKYREQFDIVVSRAVAPLNILCELALPYVKVGGVFLAMKTANVEGEQELAQAQKAIATLGGRYEKCVDYLVAQDMPERRILFIKKTAKTPLQYPRKYAKIKGATL